MPFFLRNVFSQIIAGMVYLPLAKISWALERIGFNVDAIPLSAYRMKSFYSMRTDSLDRFGTRLEHRFTRDEITQMMEAGGLKDVQIGTSFPYWCAIGWKA